MAEDFSDSPQKPTDLAKISPSFFEKNTFETIIYKIISSKFIVSL